MLRNLFPAICCLLCYESVQAQSTIQNWLEYMGNIQAAPKLNIELAGTFSTVLGKPKWRALDIQCTPEYAVSKNLDIMAALLMSNTFQNEAVSTLEIRVMAGARYHFSPDQRLQSRLLGRFEQRNLLNLATNDWDESTRSRFRFELIYPINAVSMKSKAKTWYCMTDLEAFVNFSKVKERFANRMRYRAGIGYMYKTNIRFEFMYTRQASVNTLENEPKTSENIFRFRMKQYFIKHQKKAPANKTVFSLL